jgi:hypothetical protein
MDSASQPVTFDQASAGKIRDAVRRVLGDNELATDRTGDRGSRGAPNREFWAKITGHAGAGPYKYAFIEVERNGSGAVGGFSTRTGGRTGSTSENWAILPADQLDGSPTNIDPLATGTYVRIIYDISGSTPFWTIVEIAPPSGFTGTSYRYGAVSWDGTDLKQERNQITYKDGLLKTVGDTEYITIDTPDPECP